MKKKQKNTDKKQTKRMALHEQFPCNKLFFYFITLVCCYMAETHLLWPIIKNCLTFRISLYYQQNRWSAVCPGNLDSPTLIFADAAAAPST